MKIIPNYIYANTPIKGNQSKPVFGNSVSNPTESSVKEIPNVTPDYNVSAPMSYQFVEDIKLSDDLTAKSYKLANGQKVVIVPKDGTTVVKTYVNTGSMNEPDNLRGISHYIEHNLFNGSETLGDSVFFDEVNKMGAETNASTSFSITDYFISSNLLDDNDLETKIKLQAGMLQSPKFLLDKLEKEKKIVNSEINMCLSDDENIGYTETIKNLFNVKSSSLDLVAGSTDNITALTRDDVVNYFNNNYYPANMTTVITGEVDPDETMKLVSKYFTSKKTPVQNRHYEKMTQIEQPIRRDIISQKSDGAASIFLGFAGPENANAKDKVHLRALSIFMGALSNSKMSPLERKYSTGINISPERLGTKSDDKTMTLIQAEVKDDYVEVFLKDLYNNLSKLAQTPPTQDELTAIKYRMKKGREEMLESSYALNSNIGHSFLNNNLEYLKNYNDYIDKMTAEDIQNIAKKYLDLNKVALTVVHPVNVKADDIQNQYKSAANLSFTGLNKKVPIDTSRIKEYRMPNNFSIIMNDVNTNTVEYRFEIAQKDWIPKKAAVADILSEMLTYSGTKNMSLSDLSSKFDVLGASTGVTANQYGVYIDANFPAEKAKETLDLFREKIQTPDLSEKVFKQALQRCEDYYLTTEVSAFDKFDKSIFKGTPSSITIDDKLESLSNITLEDVKSFYNDILNSGQGQVVVSGPFRKKPELKQIIFDEIGKFDNVQPKDITLSKTYTPVENIEVHTSDYKKNQAQIIEGFKFPYTQNVKDSVCLSLLNEILGGSPSSRLFTDLRESRHLAYSVFSNFDAVDDFGVMYLKIGTTTENQETGETSFDNIQKSIDGFNENIKKISTEKVSEEELDAAKKAFKTTILSPMEMTVAKTFIINQCARNPYGVNYVNKKLEIIDSITPEDILNTAKNVFGSKPIYSIAATKASLDANKEYLDSLKNG